MSGQPRRQPRPPARLLISLPLESRCEIHLDAGNLEDEQRLRGWLRRSSTLRELPEILERALDDLDAYDDLWSESA